jgi:hypothetical protein
LKLKSQAVVPRIFNPSTQEAEAVGQPGLQSEFQDSQGYTEKKNPVLKNQPTDRPTNQPTHSNHDFLKRKNCLGFPCVGASGVKLEMLSAPKPEQNAT